MFLQSLCQRMNLDKRDVLNLFQELRIVLGNNYYLNSEKMKRLESYLQKDEIDILDIKRIYRYLDKNVKKEDVELETFSDSD